MHRFREKMQALLVLYNDLAEEARDGSDSSSSEEEEDDDRCSLM